jgi:hypothetical protein
MATQRSRKFSWSVGVSRPVDAPTVVYLANLGGCPRVILVTVLPHTESLRRAVDEATLETQPIRALEALVELRSDLDAQFRVQVSRALAAGFSFGDLARVLGISRQAAHRRFRDLAPYAVAAAEQRLMATEPAAQVLRLARDEAVRSDAAALASEHVLIGVLRGGGREARSLHARGITVAAARAAAAAGAGSDRLPDPGGPAAGMRRVLHDAKVVAIARGEREVGVGAVMLAAIDDADGGARRVLSSLHVSVPSLRGDLGGRRRASRGPSRTGASNGPYNGS